jgi:hypothetical protein
MFLLLTLFACTDAPVASHALDPERTDRPVWMFEQTEQGWRRSPTPVGHGMSSLGLGVQGDTLVLTAQCFWEECGSLLWRQLTGPPVHAIASQDLEHWEPRMWRLVDPDDRVPIDTELHGEHIWYFGTPAGQHGDPALVQADHTIYRATLDGDTLRAPEAMLSGAGLADPAPVTYRGRQMVFLTTLPGRQIGRATGSPLQLDKRWDHVSVPHAMVVDEALWLWAHTVREGRHVPLRSVSTDGEHFSSFEAVLPTEDIDCANPVGTVWQGRPVVFCVSEPLDGPQ